MHGLRDWPARDARTNAHSSLRFLVPGEHPFLTSKAWTEQEKRYCPTGISGAGKAKRTFGSDQTEAALLDWNETGRGAAAAGEEDGDRRDQGKGDECSEERMPGVRWKWKVPRDAGKAIVFYGKRERDQR